MMNWKVYLNYADNAYPMQGSIYATGLHGVVKVGF